MKPSTREDLYAEVWQDPVKIVAARYGLSDVGLAKICRKMRIPLPFRGYWARLQAGQKPRPIPLPTIEDSYSLSWTLTPISEAQRKRTASLKNDLARLHKLHAPITVSSRLESPHPLVAAAAKKLKRMSGWDNPKGLRSAPNEIINICATETSIDRALTLMDALLKGLGQRSILVSVDKHNGETLIAVEGLSLPLVLEEKVRRTKHINTTAEERAWKRYWSPHRAFGTSDAPYPNVPDFDYHPTGKLTLRVGRHMSASWSDTDKTRLENRLNEVLAGIFTIAAKIKLKNDEDVRREGRRNRLQARYEFLCDRRDRELRAFKQLESEAERWQQAQKLRAYITAREMAVPDPGEITPEMIKWLAWARAKADWIDPLIVVSDPVLDAPAPTPPRYGDYYPDDDHTEWN